jgi:hypothetical protein
MNNSAKKSSCEPDLRSLLKNQHKKVYAICRFFAHNYQEHQRLFADIIAAASQNIRSRRDNRADKQTLLLRACINMAALHSISLELEPARERRIQFKSPDYQRSISNFRDSVKGISDLEKFRLFLELENVPAEEVSAFTGITSSSLAATKKQTSATAPARNFIPYIKEKLIWS